MEKPTKEELERAQKNKRSLVSQLERMDIYSKFKVICEIKGIKIREGLRQAIRDYTAKHAK